MLNELVQTATSMITGIPPRDGWIDTDLGGLRIRRIAHRQAFECNLLGPLCGIVLQGAKNVVTGDRQFTSVAGDAVIVSHHVPAVSRVTEGSDALPYLGLMLPLDLSLLGSIELEIRDAIPARRALGAIEKMRASREILDAFLRLVSLYRTPVEARVLAPLVVRELHLRFLLAPEGAILRDLLSRDSRASRISRAIAEIRQTGHLTPVASLARTAGMGPSAFMHISRRSPEWRRSPSRRSCVSRGRGICFLIRNEASPQRPLPWATKARRSSRGSTVAASDARHGITARRHDLIGCGNERAPASLPAVAATKTGYPG